jgi:hypothetical protein
MTSNPATILGDKDAVLAWLIVNQVGARRREIAASMGMGVNRVECALKELRKDGSAIVRRTSGRAGVWSVDESLPIPDELDDAPPVRRVVIAADAKPLGKIGRCSVFDVGAG